MAASKYKFNLIDSTTRRQQIEERAAEARTLNRVRWETKFRGGREPLAIVQMSVDHLLYRLENFRTAMSRSLLNE